MMFASARLATTRIRDRCNTLLVEKPIVTNSITAGFLYGSSDLAAQNLERWLGVARPGKTEYNYDRTVRMATFGVFFAGPVLANWYPLLHKATAAFRVGLIPVAWNESFRKAVRLDSPAERAKEVGVKVFFDNALFQAPFITMYFIVMGYLEGLSSSEVYAKTTENFHAAWMYGAFLWVPVQSINFWFIPVSHHALVVNMVNIGWKVRARFLPLRHPAAPNVYSHAIKLLR